MLKVRAPFFFRLAQATDPKKIVAIRLFRQISKYSRGKLEGKKEHPQLKTLYRDAQLTI